MSVPIPSLTPNPWLRILDALEKKINRHSYDTWLKPTKYSHANGGVLFIRVPTAEFRHIGEKYADLIQEAMDRLLQGRTAPPARCCGGRLPAGRAARRVP